MEGIQHAPRSWGLTKYIGLFKDSDSLAELEAIRRD
jgi:hypothetical protein